MAALATPGATVGVQPGGPYEVMAANASLRLGTPGGKIDVNLTSGTAAPEPSSEPAARHGLWASIWGAR